MADIKLFYFQDVRGKGEIIRMVLTAGGANFEDVRFKMTDWFSDPSYKKESPFGQLPYVIYKGKKIAQSIPLTSYFAKKFGLYGESDEDALRQEVVMHLCEDLRFPNLRDWFFAKDEKKAELAEKLTKELFPRYLTYLETLLKDDGNCGFFVGDSVTAADMYVHDILETVLGIDPDALKDFPLLQVLRKNVDTFPPLQDYLANRPKSEI